MELADLKNLLNVIHEMRSAERGWTKMLGYSGLSSYDEIPKSHELLIIYAPYDLLGDSEYLCWQSTIVFKSRQLAEKFIESLPSEIRTSRWMSILSLYKRSNEVFVQLGLSDVPKNPSGGPSKARGRLLSIRLEFVDGKPLAYLRSLSVR